MLKLEKILRTVWIHFPVLQNDSEWVRLWPHLTGFLICQAGDWGQFQMLFFPRQLHLMRIQTLSCKVMIFVITRIVSYCSSSFASDTFCAVSLCEKVGIATPVSWTRWLRQRGFRRLAKDTRKKACSAPLQTLALTHVPCNTFYEKELKIL